MAATDRCQIVDVIEQHRGMEMVRNAWRRASRVLSEREIATKKKGVCTTE